LADSEKNEEIFYILLKALNFLDKNNFRKSVMQYLTSYFILRLLERSGFGPNFHQCQYCETKISNTSESEEFYFSPQEGGIICGKCIMNFKSNHYFPIGKNSIKVIRLLTRGDINLIQRLPEKESLKSLEFCESYLNDIVEKPLSSPKFLKRVQEL
jgi:DNA repair protein RecO